jgi:hypothetical protein
MMLLLVAVMLVPEACVRTGLLAVSKDSMEKEGDVGLHERDLVLLREQVEGAQLEAVEGVVDGRQHREARVGVIGLCLELHVLLCRHLQPDELGVLPGLLQHRRHVRRRCHLELPRLRGWAVPWLGAASNVAASTTVSRMRTLLDDAMAGVVLDQGAGWVAY